MVSATKPGARAGMKPQWQQALDDFGPLLADAARDPRARTFAALMARPAYAGTFAQAFGRGYLAGGLRALADWINDLQGQIAAFTGELPSLTLAVGMEAARGLFEEQPKGLLPDTRLVFQASEMVAPLKLLAVLSVENSLSGFLEEVDLLAADLATACARAGREWQEAFLAANGDAERQGLLAGELYGAAVVEALRVFVDLRM